ncbi:hypothetical protein [Kangiella geojedonensis]|uniref:Lipoprotein n=1 Tax=Kangiella geojedonensis TaxID=914150 RepID=A0A0F6RDM7_9GAMM|nr:hypothetical protein [Kangiella geojedonensis]AKE53091.1 hypothetical protein TQ33_2165 [Kangiella geojedonensis]
MRRLTILLSAILLSGCITTKQKYIQMVSDPKFAILLVKGDNQKAALSATVEIKNIKTGQKTHLNDMIRHGNRGKPVVFKLEPGVYKLSRYLLYNNVKPSLDHLNYFFSVEAGKVNYVGDWSFKEQWGSGALDVDFSVKYNPETINTAKQTFDILLTKWKLKSY